jgi:[pyruvate, water dikinase]-phosphate phosphotransferase / [pyruvate, water dikinase] kinase
MKIFVHLISDSTGETVERIAKASMNQFGLLDPQYYTHNLIRSPEKLAGAIAFIKDHPGIVFYTLAQKKQKELFRESCDRSKNLLIDVMEPIINSIETFTGMHNPNYGSEKAKFGMQYTVDEQYENKINAIHWTIDHDDGQHQDTILGSDIILLGASRTSKTPTSIHLSLRGHKVGNIPLIQNIPLDPSVLENISSPTRAPLYVGLTISPDRLFEIRSNRIKVLKDFNSHIDIDSYADMEKIREELVQFRRFFLHWDIPILDVTKVSVEETSARITTLYQKKLVRQD